MKKILVASILTIISFVGAYATQYSTGPNSTGSRFGCVNSGGAPICSSVIGPTTIIYVLSSSTPTTLPIIEYNYHFAIL